MEFAYRKSPLAILQNDLQTQATEALHLSPIFYPFAARIQNRI
jgi:hypothetical protein